MLDNLDKKIILELQGGRRSFLAIARKLQVHEMTIRRRFKRLEENGIVSMSVIPDLNILGYKIACVVGIQLVSVAYLQEVAKQLSEYPNVHYLAQVTGQYDFIAIVVDRSTRSFGSFLENKICGITGVSRTETFVALNIYKKRMTSLDVIRLLNNQDFYGE